MIGADFYRLATEGLGNTLSSRGWQPTNKTTWVRRDSDGVSRLALDARRSFERFAVLVTWDPDDLVALVLALFGNDVSVESQGFLCGPYLTPAGVFPRPRYWPSRTKASLLKSLAEVGSALRVVGEPWLQSLRDPLVLAEAADPVAALWAGFAWERAGRPERARPLYEEMWRRLDGAFAMRSRQAVPDSTKRSYLFIADRLGYSNELVDQLRIALTSAGGPTRG